MKFEKDRYQKKFSLIIGCQYVDARACRNLINRLGDNLYYLKEIILIFNSINNEKKFNEIIKLNFPEEYCSLYFYKEKLFPGAARNEGISKSAEEYIAFLDVSTIPQNDWLEKSIISLNINNFNGVLGQTKYKYITSFEKSFIAATYGEQNLYTVPGSILKKSLINKVGYFLPNLKSGEDSEWIKRISQLEKNIKKNDVGLIHYEGIIGKNLSYLSRKWFSNYSNIAQNYNVEIERQRFIYIIFFFFTTAIVTFFWNDVIAQWNEESFWYVPNITKISLLCLIFFYLLIRLFIFPKRKKVKFKYYSFIEILNFIFISIFLDIVKFFAYLKTIIRPKI